MFLFSSDWKKEKCWLEVSLYVPEGDRDSFILMFRCMKWNYILSQSSVFITFMDGKREVIRGRSRYPGRQGMQ